MNVVWVFLGGGIGAALRFLISKGTTVFFTGNFPLGTLLANLISCLLLAIVTYKFSDSINTNTKLFLITGICGGLSTFSTFSFETFELLKNNYWPWAIANVLISVVACLLVLYIVYKAT